MAVQETKMSLGDIVMSVRKKLRTYCVSGLKSLSEVDRNMSGRHKYMFEDVSFDQIWDNLNVRNK
jgi:hypothetical protein